MLREPMDVRSDRAIVTPIILGVAAAGSYCFLPDLAIGEAPYQAAWVATGVALCNLLMQNTLENPEEVLKCTIFTDHTRTATGTL